MMQKSRMKVHVKKNDIVEVISGNDIGKRGKILKVFSEKNRVIVEGVNIRSKHQRPNNQHPNGSILKREQSIHSSNVKRI